ncbi:MULTISPECIES: hypothetical protein [Rhizobium]|uniref:Uncharacterized protein n=1 Tax=Rhizobium tropici TaxID=398 RepID=A0A6P1CA91_RHITR|nr:MULTISPECIES: hypothetical protein [Rhizobium]MBB4244732.1 hypothetical protein [Rhizobium tropici]MBB5596119.1 hypothetical protein [Rhizobium tropici]MBB6495137.1 hypothetical protein [Rhizobium tropici]NEV13697.1 hypothetical protein [Rhizobium tropici]TGE97909.1 hypothetical protein C9417_09920 [Rhizobium sp. SEMIA 4088]
MKRILQRDHRIAVVAGDTMSQTTSAETQEMLIDGLSGTALLENGALVGVLAGGLQQIRT